ncbi:HD-GYP domain-containing protein [Bremerella sp.]|uniref:HD-GYP domain-containing protein n=1 Tax=Bremerella sp. TaxID=2795602 RepID=UPI00391CBBA4
MTDTAKRQKYLPVPLALMCLTQELPVDVYWCLHQGAEPVLLRGQNIEIADDEFPRLLESGVETVYIPRDQGEVFQKHLQDNVRGILDNQDIPIDQRMSFLNSTGRTMLQEVFRSDNLDKTLDSVSVLSEHMTSLISQNEVVASELFDVLQHDYHTYTHSYNVASYAMLLAQEVGIRDKDELQRISMGGLLHDLGKLRIPNHILTKKERLSEAEWQTIQRHPTDGFIALAQRPDVTFDQLMMVYQHHEKLDGSGYPVGVDGDEIHVLARICTVVDIFEALTSNRPYRNPNTTKEALEILDQMAPTKLDGDMVKCWKALMLK